MSRSLYLILLLIGGAVTAYAQPDIEWQHNYGGAGGQYGEGLVVSPQGGYAIGGASGGGSHQFWLCRINAEGEELWNVAYDLEGQSNHCFDVCMTNDNGFLLVGQIRADNTYGWHVMRVNTEGEVIWRRTYHQGNAEDTFNWAWAVAAVQSDLFIIAGYLDVDGQNTDGLAMLINGNGDVVWETQVGGGQSQGFTDVVVAPGGYALCGSIMEDGDKDAWLVKLNQDGEVDWQTRYGVEQQREWAWGLTRTREDGFGIIAQVTGDNDNYDSYLIHTNSVGEVLWDHTYEHDGRELGYAILQNGDRGFTFVGQRNAEGRYNSGYAQNTDIDGAPTWDMGAGRFFFYTECKDIVYDPTERAILMCGTTYAGNNQALMDALLVKVAQINHPPEVVGRSPGDSVIVLLAGEDTTFSVEAIDIDDDPLAYRWVLDGDTVAQEEIFFYTANQLGVHRIACYISDWQFTVSTEWEVQVFQLIRGFVPLGTRFEGLVDTSVFFGIWSGIPHDSLHVAWNHNGEAIGNDTSVTVDFSLEGEQILRVDAEWLGRRDSVIWTVQISPAVSAPYEGALPVPTSYIEIHPNPFNATTQIEYGLDEAADVSLRIYDLTGHEVTALIRVHQKAGYYRILWDGRNSDRIPVASGVYFVRLETPDVTTINRLMLVR